METINPYALEDLPLVADQLFKLSKGKKIWAFYGAMGVGKTTLIKVICQHLGVTNEVTSPTFSLVNEYPTKTGKMVYHFDFYRIKNMEEVMDIGYEEYFDSGNICLLEWPEKIEPLLEEEDCFAIRVTITPDGKRIIHLD